MRFGKFVIPNPFGPLEEPRFCAYLVRTWKKGETAASTRRLMCATTSTSRCSRRLTPIRCRDRGRAGSGKLNPSGYVESQGAFAERFAAAMRPRLGLACRLDLATQTEFSEPMMRVNTKSAARYVAGWDETAAWDEAAEAYRG